MNVLCIEPDIILAREYKKAFCFTPSDVCRICLDPQAAIEQIDAQVPDVIIMEIQLAPLSGFAFLQELRSYEDFSHIPVVVYSSVPQESFTESASSWKALNVSKYFYKATTPLDVVARYAHKVAHAD